MLLKLPNELLVIILHLLSIKDVVRIAQTCRNLHCMVMQTTELRYAIELAVGHLHDKPSCKMGLRERLCRLLELRARWRTLSARSRTTLAFPFEGILDILKGCDFFRDVVFSGTSPGNPDAFNPLSLLLAEIPSTRYEFKLKIDGRKLHFHKFAVDVDMDLLVLLEERFPDTSYLYAHSDDSYDYEDTDGAGFTLYLRSLSSHGKRAHPGCTRAVLEYCFPTYFFDGPTINSLMIVDGTICVHAWSGHTQCVAMWNWMSGRLIAVMNSTEAGLELEDVAFTSPNVFIATSSTSGHGYGPSQPYLHVFSISGPFPGCTDWEHDAGVRYLLRFSLPDMASKHIWCRPYVRTGPFAATRTDTAPFTPFWEARIYALRLQVYDMTPRDLNTPDTRKSGCLLLFMHLRDFADIAMKYINVSMAESTGEREIPTVPWSVWGPDYTRLFVQDKPPERRRCYDDEGGWEPQQRWIDGTRAVCTVSDPRATGPSVTQVLDFNTLDRYRRHVPTGDNETCAAAEPELVMEPTTVDWPHIFKEPITTRIPFYTTPVRDSPLFGDDDDSHGAIMLDGERLYRFQEHPKRLVSFTSESGSESEGVRNAPRENTVDVDVFSF